MPDTISLRAYLARLEEHLRANSADEVIHHCRHILQYFPKHADTYRMLGRALLHHSRWDEAAAVLGRVLSVYPDDYTAHLGLAEIYGERQRGDEAIWHLERAFEHEPNNEELIAGLRDLYKRFKGAELGKIQLTAGAIARQYGRNGLYEQAADTLRHALETHKDRVDLRLLLAQMLWGAEQQVEAAEVALDVLALLPDCMDANRILTRLWLLEERPSDAQRYINHIEAVDPYAALELATGTQAPDSAFTLPELDYRRFAAETAITSNQPDWLQDIGAEGFSDYVAEPVVVPRRPVEATPPPTSAPDDANDALTETDLQRLKPTSTLPKITDEVPEVDLRFDDRLDDVEPIGSTTEYAAGDLRRETSSLASIFTQRDGDDVPDWLAQADDEATVLEDESLPMTSNVDPLAWLHDSAVEMTDDTPTTPDEPLDFEPLPPDDEDPLAWLRESGIEVENEDLAKLTHEHPITSESAADDDEDPLAWLRDSGIEVEDAPLQAAELDPYETVDDTPIQDPAADPLGWMAAYDNEIFWGDETPADESLTANEPSATPADSEAPVDAFASLFDDEEADSPESSPALAVEASVDDEDDFNWLQNEALFEPEAESPAEADDAEADQDQVTTGLLRRLGATGELDETNILDKDDAEAAAPGDATQWFSDEGGSAQAPAPQDALAADRREAMTDKDDNLNPDWQNEDEQNDGESTSPDWLSDFVSDEDEQLVAPAEPAEEVPEWLAALGPNYVQPESADEAARAEEADDATLGWTPEVQAADEDSPAQAEDFPSWLGAEEMAASSARENPNPDWLSDFQSEADLEPVEEPDADNTLAEADDVPAWLSELQPPDATGLPIAALHDDEDEDADESLGWLNQVLEKEEAAEAGELPQPVASGGGDDEDNEPPAWLPDFETGEQDAVSEEPIAAPEMPSWLNDLNDADGSETGEDEDDLLEVEEFNWGSELDEDEEAADDGVPVPSLDAEPDGEQEGFNWTDTFDATAPQAAFDDDTPEWLRDLQADAEAPEARSDEATVVTVQPGEEPEWLAETLAEHTEAEPEAEAEGESAFAEFDEFEGAMSAAEDEALAIGTEHRPAQNAPDWLNAMVPGVDLDYTPESEDAAEPEAAEPVSEHRRDREYEWLVDIVEEETQPAPEPTVAAQPDAPRFSFSKLPAWLRGKQAATGDKSE